MKDNLICPKCGSNKNTEIITGGITIKVLREGDFTVKEEIVYDKSDKHSKYICTKCEYEFKEEDMK